MNFGFGNAIIFHLYKPIAENNEKEIAILVRFYKKVYTIIASVVFVLGIIIMPFIKNIVGEVSIKENINFLFFLALIDIVASYLLTYKRSVLYADQKNYVVNIVHIFYTIIMNIVEIFLILITKNYILYLIVKIVFRTLENVVINSIVNKMYPYINSKLYNESLDKTTREDIGKKVKGLLFHKIGSSIISGTDNIIISKIIGVVTVGIYSNYNLIIMAVNNVIIQVFNSILSVIGNLLIENDKNKSYDIYKKIQFVNSWICCLAATCILCLIQPFIILWLDSNYLLEFSVVIVLAINFYVTGMRRTNHTFKEAAGIFYEDRFVPIIEVVLNITVSIILGKYFGLIGVFIGTLFSSAALFLYSYPVYVYKKLFGKSYLEFLKEFCGYLILSLGSMWITYKITTLIVTSSSMVRLIVNAVICIIVPNVMYFICFRRSEEFKYYIDVIKSFWKKEVKE